MKRIRALDAIDDTSKYKCYNPLFLSAVKEFDDAFNRGTETINYVCRKNKKGSYERYFLDHLFTGHNNPDLKWYRLEGSVGSGKTAFCQYINDFLANYYQTDCFVIYMSLEGFQEHDRSDFKNIKQKLVKKVISQLLDRCVFKSKEECIESIWRHNDYESEIKSIAEALKLERSIDLYVLMFFLVQQSYYDKVLLIIDNLDECDIKTIQSCSLFADEIMSIVKNIDVKKHFSLLIPVREYTVKRFDSQTHYAVEQLAPLDYGKVVRSDISSFEESLAENSAEWERKVEGLPKDYRDQFIFSRDFILTKERRSFFFERITSLCLSQEEKTFFSVLTSLSGSNLKLLLQHLYNFFHSCKLPLTALFEKCFLSEDYRSPIAMKPITLNLVIECLMNIHYPFYDVKQSFVINLFNPIPDPKFEYFEKDKKAGGESDYKWTLVIIRVLNYLLNTTKDNTLKTTRDVLASIGYPVRYVDMAIQKCFYYALIESDHGNSLSKLEDDSKLAATSIGSFYIYEVLPTTNYLQNVCEDTYVDRAYHVSIFDKYSFDKGKMPGKNSRFLSVSKFLDFVNNEETQELFHIETRFGQGKYHYLESFGINYNGQGYTIREYTELVQKRRARDL